MHVREEAGIIQSKQGSSLCEKRTNPFYSGRLTNT